MADKEITYNCTVAKMAEQLDIPLWKAMEMGKYFRACYRERIKRVGIEIILEEMGITNIVYTETPEGEAKEYTIKDLANAILKKIDKEIK